MIAEKLQSRSRPIILISDDNPYVIKALERLIDAEGGRIIADLNSRVVELARTHQPELIILDIAQKTDGRLLLRKLKREDATRDIEVFVLTGNYDPVVRELCLQLGASDYFVKPPDARFFLKVGHCLAVGKQKRMKQ